MIYSPRGRSQPISSNKDFSQMLINVAKHTIGAYPPAQLPVLS
jgi:hypothetical protein